MELNQTDATGNFSAMTRPGEKSLSLAEVAGFSSLFCVVGVVGLVGNGLVIYIVLSDKKMRSSVTNLFIINLALADSIIMLFGIPEIVQFMLDRGWLLGAGLCKLDRFVLVTSLYGSVLTLVAVCIERYIAIVYPIKAHILCTRRRVLQSILLIWVVAGLCGLPTVVYIQLNAHQRHNAVVFCTIVFPDDHIRYFLVFKYLELLFFYLFPMVIQISCYVVIGRRLFVGVEKLHGNKLLKRDEGEEEEKSSRAIRARKGVVKMLIACVLVYFLSYSPLQVMLLYNTFAPAPFHETWSFLVFVTTLAYINSAANPIIYCVFSENFRRKFSRLIGLRSSENATRHAMLSAQYSTEYISMSKLSRFRSPRSSPKAFNSTESSRAYTMVQPHVDIDSTGCSQ